MKLVKILVPVSVLALVAITAVSASASASSGSTGGGGGWVDADAPRRIRAYSAAIEAHTGWTGLGDFLAATAKTESRGNAAAVGDSGRSWGWFQIRPAAKCMQWLGLEGPELLHDEALQVAVAACHAYRLGTIYDSAGQVVQRRDVRRGWKYPYWVAEQYRDVPETKTNQERFRNALRAVGVPESFMYGRIFPPGMEMQPVGYLVQVARGASVA